MYKDRNEDLVKLTIRLDRSYYDKFKKLCSIGGVSVNNHINFLIRQNIYANRSIFDDSTFFDGFQSDTKK